MTRGCDFIATLGFYDLGSDQDFGSDTSPPSGELVMLWNESGVAVIPGKNRGSRAQQTPRQQRKRCLCHLKLKLTK